MKLFTFVRLARHPHLRDVIFEMEEERESRGAPKPTSGCHVVRGPANRTRFVPMFETKMFDLMMNGIRERLAPEAAATDDFDQMNQIQEGN